MTKTVENFYYYKISSINCFGKYKNYQSRQYRIYYIEYNAEEEFEIIYFDRESVKRVAEATIT